MRPKRPFWPSRYSLRLAAALVALGAVPTVLETQAATKRAPQARPEYVEAASPIAAGEYLTIAGGCNDCHTPGWAESNGNTPPAERFTGSNVGYRGPWGTSYPANLRLVAQEETEDGWVQILTTADSGKGKPPMPWMNTAQTSDRDLRAIYRYIRSLGPRGVAAPQDLPAGRMPATRFINFVPVQPLKKR